jgi:glycosyltransferase involved in cell wall biosynthesis
MIHVFVVPDPTATITGGNLYNASLTAALRAAGADVRVRDRASARAAPDEAAATSYWVDSLYLDALPSLRRSGARTWLIAHYLPSLVARGAIPSLAELSAEERAALAAADGFLAPSEYMARALVALGAAPRPVLVVAPGLDVAPAVDDTSVAAALARDHVAALLVGNVVPGKRVLPLVDALAPHLAAGAPLRLTIAGSLAMDPAYARACRERVAAAPALVAAVDFAGPLPRAALLAKLAASDLLVSPSCMESFGLALAEARALGLPIVARDGGNSGAHVDPLAGGCLVDSDEALAAECARLTVDRVELGRRRAAARAARPRPRSWSDAARDFLSHFPAKRR